MASTNGAEIAYDDAPNATPHRLAALSTTVHRITRCCSSPHCRRQADTIHLLDWSTRGYPQSSDIVIRFACPRHNPGGYWISLDQYELDRGGWLDHLAGKDWRGDLALRRAGLGCRAAR